MAQGGKTGFDEFYDYERSKQLIEAVKKDIADLGTVFKAFSTNMNSFNKQFKKSFDETTKSINDNNKAIKSLDKTQIEASQSIVKFTKENEKLNESGKKTKVTIQSIDQVVKTFGKSVTEQKALVRTLTNEFERLDPTVAKNASRLSKISEELIKARTNINQMSKATRDSNNVLNAATGSYNALTQAIAKDVAQLKQVPGAVDKSSSAYRKNRVEIEHLQSKIRSNTEALKQFDAQMGRNFRNVGNYSSALGGLNSVAGQFASAFGFVGGAFMIAQGIKTAIAETLAYSDALTNVQRTTDMSDAAVRSLSDSLELLNTRTSQEGLLQIATAAGRLQVAEKDLLSFTEAVDIVSQALGDELQGNAEEIATSLGRIISLFGDDKTLGTEKAIIHFGSVINELGKNSKSNAQYITDFTLRLAGVGAQANITSDEMAALGAVFGEIAPQRVEAATTAVQRFLIEMGGNVPKFAKLAGMEVKEFSKILEEDAVEAFLKVFEVSGQTTGGLEDISSALGDLGVDQERAKSILGSFALSVDRTRELLKLARLEAIEGNSVYEEHTKRIDNAAGAWERLKNEIYETAIGNESSETFLQAVAENFIHKLRIINGYYTDIAEAKKNKEADDKKTLEVETAAIEAFQIAQKEGIKTFSDFIAVKDEFIHKSEDSEKRLLIEKAVLKLYDDQLDETTKKEKELLEEEKKKAEALKVQIPIIKTLTDSITKLNDEREVATSLTRIIAIDKETEALQKQLDAINALKDRITEPLPSTTSKNVISFAIEEPKKKDILSSKEMNKGIKETNYLIRERARLTKMAMDAGMDDFATMILGYENFADKISEIEAAITYQVQLNQEKRMTMYQAMWDAASMVGNQYFTNESINRQNDFEEFRRTQDLRMEAAGENHELRAQIEAETQEKERELRIQQAEAARDQVLFNIAIDTAQKIANIKLAASVAAANAFAITAAFDPTQVIALANATRAAATVLTQIPIALGFAALQTGLVLSQPLPAYAEGGIVKENGAIMVNDRPRNGKVHREVITTPKGQKFFYNTDKPVITSEIPKGSYIDKRDVSEHANISGMLDGYSPSISQTRNLQKQFEIIVKQENSNNEMYQILRKENGQLIEGFNTALSNQPKEVWGISHGRLAKTYIRSNQRITGWRDKNRD